jgi:hypothetical protein
VHVERLERIKANPLWEQLLPLRSGDSRPSQVRISLAAAGAAFRAGG